MLFSNLFCRLCLVDSAWSPRVLSPGLRGVEEEAREEGGMGEGRGECMVAPAERWSGPELPWAKALQRRTKALQRRMERAEEIEDVIAARRGGTRTAPNFQLRQGEGRVFLGKALSTCTGNAASLMLKAISNTLPTK